ncbi:MAG TPA: hypothetical protein VFL81_00240 [Candidatus Saccharimonadales bacterium]|nr:hypothetical protein [Candidatus Saccharimonadales bacterium]
MTETSVDHHIPVESKNSRPQSIEVDHEHFETLKLDMSETPAQHKLAVKALESIRRRLPVDEEVTERANRVTVGNDEYERV